MNIVSDPKLSDPKLSDPRLAGAGHAEAGTLLSPDANLAAALASANGVLTVDLDAIVANWRKLEKTAVPAECGGVIKADGLWMRGRTGRPARLRPAGCKTFFVATLEEARAARAAVPSAAIYVLNGFFQNTGEAYAKIDCRPVHRRSQRTGRMGRVLPPYGLERRRGDPDRHRHARGSASPSLKRRA